MEVLRQLHHSVAQTFEHTFDNAYRELNAQLATRDARIKEAECLAEAAKEERDIVSSEADSLRDEVIFLRKELGHNDVGLEDDNIPEKSDQLEKTYAPQHFLRLRDSNGEEDPSSRVNSTDSLADKYVALYAEVQTLVQVSGELRKQVKRHKRKLLHLQKCFSRKSFTLVLEGNPVTFERSTKIIQGNNGPIVDRQSDSLNAGESKPVDHHVVKEEGVSRDPTPKPFVAPGSQSLKRKATMLGPSIETPDPKHPDRNETKQSVTTNCERTRPRLSHNSSSQGGPDETQDLDEVRCTVETPTKDRGNHQGRSESWSVSTEPPSTKSPYPQFNGLETPTNGRDHLPAFQFYGKNLRSVRETSQRQPGNRSTKNSEKMARFAVKSIAEDGNEGIQDLPIGDESKSLIPGVQSPGSSSTNDPQARRRLQNLLESPLRPRHPLGQNYDHGNRADTLQKAQCHPDEGRKDPLPRDGAGMLAKSVEKTTSSQTPLASKIQQSTGFHPRQPSPSMENTDIHPEDEPLRARPPHKLDLSHFRINPEYNQGLDFAFDSVLRKREERKCADGCTRPSCCGEKFLAMARLGGISASSATSLSLEGDDKSILEEYMGKDAHLLDGMKPEDRQALLYEAKAKLIANRFGKHRNQHQRPASPPGFWRTDMPSTQELDYDREEARRVERDKVRERYREATRPGGLWKFADE
ncbi:SAE2-domain-containing protein [Aspergillus campestris IBT 28561]|uniref:SAE2-domain-containing protein n=1 Tax=Aspergillus campestris (strain IBT 28561) TaxID=1392248 RepID=A0A2I1CXQ1_ASPC2|nr:SAE2-domain-containing protein [Aspergillus campestris IBT 28561]PKY02406.1 SAE2-domain-containing protein [Aspergillus campestris IBT 28561]